MTDVAISQPMPRRPARILVAIVAVIGVLVIGYAVWSAAPAGSARTVSVTELNDSGVTGTVAFRDAGGRTEVSIVVEPGDHPDMPAHIHPGSCDDLTPQPKFPLENVRNGRSVTVVPASVDELFAGNLAVNIHRSNDDLQSYTACVDLR